VKEFLTDEKLLDIDCLRSYYLSAQDSHIILAKVCLTYLNFNSFSHWQFNRPHDNCDELWEEIYYDSSHPLLKYAVQLWVQHARLNPSDQILLQLMCKLFDPNKTPNFLLWLEGYFSSLELTTPKSCSTLHCAATLGFSEVCTWLIKKGADINADDAILGTPLICALRGKFGWTEERDDDAPSLSTIQALIDAGAHASEEITILGSEGENSLVTPMSLALEALDIHPRLGANIFRQLMNSNCASPFADSEFWWNHENDIHCNSTNSDEDLVSEAVSLFNWMLGHRYASTLDIASKEKMVLFITRSTKLCDVGIFSGSKAKTEVFQSTESITELILSAADYGQTRLINSLIDEKVDPKILSRGLPYAASSGSRDILDALLQYCPRNDQTVLQQVQLAWIGGPKTGKISIMERLLAYGIDVNLIVEEISYNADLPTAMRQGEVSDKAEINALAAAVCGGQCGVVKFLPKLSKLYFTASGGLQRLRKCRPTFDTERS